MAAPLSDSSLQGPLAQSAEQVHQAPNTIRTATWQHLTPTNVGVVLETLTPCGPDAKELIQRGLDVIGSGDSLTAAQCAGLAADMTKATMHLIYEGKGLTEFDSLELKYKEHPVKLNAWGLSRVIADMNPELPVQTHQYLSDIAIEQRNAKIAQSGAHFGYYSPRHTDINQFVDSTGAPPPDVAEGKIQAELNKSEVHMPIKALAEGESKLPDFTPEERLLVAAIADHAPGLFGEFDPGTISRAEYYTAMRTAAGAESLVRLPPALKQARVAFSDNIAFKQALYTYPAFAAWLLGFTRP